MHNFSILLKNSFNILLGTMQGKRKRKSTVVASILLVLGVLFLLGVTGYQAYTMAESFSMLGMPKLVLFHGITTTVTVILVISVMRPSTNEKSSDVDLLLSLPIPKKTIVLFKLTSKYLFDLFFVTLIFLPYFVAYQIFAEFNLLVCLMAFFVLILFPFLSVGLSCMIEFLISRVFNKSRVSSLLKSLFTVLVFIIILALMLTKQLFYGTAPSLADPESFFVDRPFSYFVLKIICNTNLLNILIFVAITLTIFLIGFFLFKSNFGKSFKKYYSNSKELKFGSSKNELGLLVKKEIYHYALTPAYFINTIIGPVLLLVLAFLILIMGTNNLSISFGISFGDSQIIATLIAIASCAMLSTGPISSSSISLEGKNFWILKSSPTNENYIFLSKILLHLIVVLPFVFVSNIAFLIAFHLSIIQFLLIFIFVFIFNILFAIFGVFINIVFCNFDWENETKVVKQSVAVLLSMLFGLVLTILPILLIFIANVDVQVVFFCSLFSYFLIAIIFGVLLFTVGKKIFRRL